MNPRYKVTDYESIIIVSYYKRMLEYQVSNNQGKNNLN